MNRGHLGKLLLILMMCPVAAFASAEQELSQVLAQTQRGNPQGRQAPMGQDVLAQALRLAQAGNYKDSSILLFQLSYSPRFRSRRNQIRYILGLNLFQMNLNQVAAFQFISVVREGESRYLRQALEKLSLAADNLGDDTLLNYALGRVRVDDFPRIHRDMLSYRIGEFQLRNNQFVEAAQSFSRVQRTSPLFAKAKYLQGVALTQANQLPQALRSFEDLFDSRRAFGPTDPSRVAAQMGIARVYYQQRNWARAIDTYRSVPRDTEAWHDTLFESSWAMLRSGRFRSALSNFHSLHSSYYEDFFIPESLLLRSIVYLYICKYEEMEKVLNLFNQIYRPVYNQIDRLLDSGADPTAFFNDMVRIIRDKKTQGEEGSSGSYQIPYLVGRRILREGDFQTSYNYITRLLEESRRVSQMPADWREAAIGQYAQRILQTRIARARERAGRQVRAHLESIKLELFDLFEQEGFIRYEMISGKRQAIQKRIAGRDLPQTQIDQATRRDYYIQNGFEYWPFRGEYWLDEIGNYHYVGTQSCD